MNVCFNGDFYLADAPLLTAQNRSFKWGDGLFETMKVFKGKLLLRKLHFERLFHSLQVLQIDLPPSFSEQILQAQILKVCRQNSCLESARVRLAVYRTDQNKAAYIIEAISLSEEINNWQTEGVCIGLYLDARKAVDAFSAIKTANYLPYVMAAKYAAENNFDDSLVLNGYSNICDSSKANIFLVKDGKISTPSLDQGCINGIMRSMVILEAKEMGYHVNEIAIVEDDLVNADEIFLTNAIQIMRWVKSYQDHSYTCEQSMNIFKAVKATIFG